MSLEKMLQVKNTFQRRIMCDNPDESGGAPKGTESNPYTLNEFLSAMQNGTWTGGYVKNLGYIEAGEYSKSSDDVEEDYGSEYVDDITRYVHNPHSSFDLDAYFGSIFSFMNEAPTQTQSGGASSSEEESPKKEVVFCKSTITYNNNLIIQIETTDTGKGKYYSLEYKQLKDEEITVQVIYDPMDGNTPNVITYNLFKKTTNFQPLAYLALANDPNLNPSFRLCITNKMQESLEVPI